MNGQRLAHYQITAHLGSGGMGEVYRARDTKLGRDVAVKVLPGNFAADQERLRRFEQEARTLAALNHPNIMAIFDTGVHDGSSYLVSELLEGQTLRDVLKDGAMPARRTLEYAIQIAHGLAAAHEKGIVHRDLKPENLFITLDGRVKILDFGLAKLLQGTHDSATLAPSAPALAPKTEQGMVLGTPGYMSPEQARGEAAEERSDIFSLGAILYEMLCKERAFQGDSAIEVMHSILKSDPPDLAERVENLPPALDRVVRRCLEKRPERRFQTAADLAFALENSISSGGSSIARQAIQEPSRLSLRRLIPLGATVFGVLIGAFGLYLAWNSSHNAITDTRPAPVLRKLTIDLSNSSEVGGSPGGAITALSIAPDNKKFVYANEEGLWLHWLDHVAPPTLLVKAPVVQSVEDCATRPFWSPQSDEVAYFSKQQIYRVPVIGGQPRLIATLPESAAPTDIVGGGAWLANGRIFFTYGSGPDAQSAVSYRPAGLYQVAATGGDYSVALPIAEDEQDYHNACALPGGRGVLFVVHRNKAGFDTIAVWTPGGSKKVLLQIPGASVSGPTYSPSGHILFERRDTTGGVWAFPFSLDKLERTGEFFRFAEEASFPSAAGDGTLIYTPVKHGEAERQQMIWVDRNGQIAGQVGPETTGLSDPRLSPDQGRVAVVAVDAGNGNLEVFDIASGNFISLTQTPDYDGNPFWYPDNSRILFSRRGGKAGASSLLVKNVGSFGEPQMLGSGRVLEFSRSGKYLIARVERRVLSGPDAPEGEVWAWRELDGQDVRFHPFPPDLDPQDVALSPDEKLLAYWSNESGRSEVSVVDFPKFTGRVPVSHDGGRSMQWNPSGTELIYMSTDRHQLWAASLKGDGGAPTKLCDLPKSTYIAPPIPASKLFQVSADGQRFLMIQTIPSKSEQQESQKPTVLLVENWIEEFREKK